MTAPSPIELEFSVRVAVVGPVRSGKSHLIKQLLFQPVLASCVDVHGADEEDDSAAAVMGAEDEMEWQVREEREEAEALAKEQQQQQEKEKEKEPTAETMPTKKKKPQQQSGDEEDENEDEDDDDEGEKAESGKGKRVLPLLSSLGVDFSHASFVFLEQDKKAPGAETSNPKSAAAATAAAGSAGAGSNGSDDENDEAAERGESAAKRRVKVTLRLEFFEVGGATCCDAKFSDRKTVEETIRKCDVVLAVYDLCDKASFSELTSGVLDAVVFQLPPEDAKPVVIVGNKFDKRKFKGLTKEEQGRAVKASEMAALEERLPHHAVATVSVAAFTGKGCARLRRELVHEALFVTQRTLAAARVFAPPASPLTASKLKKQQQQQKGAGDDDEDSLLKLLEPRRAFLRAAIVGPSSRTLVKGENKGIPTRAKGQEYLTVDKTKAKQQSQAGGFSPANKDGDGADEPPVVDVKSNREEKTEKACGCGCLCQ